MNGIKEVLSKYYNKTSPSFTFLLEEYNKNGISGHDRGEISGWIRDAKSGLTLQFGRVFDCGKCCWYNVKLPRTFTTMISVLSTVTEYHANKATDVGIDKFSKGNCSVVDVGDHLNVSNIWVGANFGSCWIAIGIT